MCRIIGQAGRRLLERATYSDPQRPAPTHVGGLTCIQRCFHSLWMRQLGEGHGPADHAPPYQGPTRPGSPAHLVPCQSDRADTLHPNLPAHPRMNQEPSLPLRALQLRRRWRKNDPINGESTGESQRTSATNHGARAKTAIYQICPVYPQRRTWKLKVFSTLMGMPSCLSMTNCYQ